MGQKTSNVEHFHVVTMILDLKGAGVYLRHRPRKLLLPLQQLWVFSVYKIKKDDANELELAICQMLMCGVKL